MLNFVTLFNSFYLSRGLALYQSLLKQCPDFHLYVVAFDDATFNYFKNHPKTHLTVISLQQFEDDELKAVKPTRSMGEYCWTSTPSTILYCITKYNLNNCTYIDADMYFYSNPKVLVDEMGSDSVLIIDHRYSPQYDQSATSGRYCVQFMTFKNTTEGMTVLKWWRNACIEWCYNRVEDGKFGDQKYLDDWTKRFKGVHELKHLGGGIAPWNVQQYTFATQNGKVIGTEIATGKTFEAVFFHYHSLKFYKHDIILLADIYYNISKNVMDIFFKGYVKALIDQSKIVLKTDPEINANGATNTAEYLPMSLATLKQYYFENLRSSKRNIFGTKLSQQIKNHYYFYLSDFN